jgi:hypothetical protein
MLAGTPVGADPALPQHPLEGGIERALLDPEHVAGELIDPLADAPTVHRLEGQRLQDQQLEGAGKQIGG